VTKTLADGLDIEPPEINPEVKKFGGMTYLRREMKRLKAEEKKNKG